MASKSTEILKEINRLISLVSDSSIQEIDKLKIIKVLLAIKLRVMELLDKEITSEAKIFHVASTAGHSVNRRKRKDSGSSDKQGLILEFIRNKSSQVGLAELSELGIAGRSLRRYLKNLKDGKRVKIEKRGRENFYSVIA